MTDIVMGNTVPLKKEIRELETTVEQIRRRVAALENPTRNDLYQDDFDWWTHSDPW